jgi:hypothetical protein
MKLRTRKFVGFARLVGLSLIEVHLVGPEMPRFVCPTKMVFPTTSQRS